LKLWPFKVEENKDGNPVVVVNLKNEEKKFLPEQLSAMILENLKNLACEYLQIQKGSKLNAVITVPAYFND